MKSAEQRIVMNASSPVINPDAGSLSFTTSVLLGILAGLLLGLPWLFASLAWIGWFAWVPLLIALNGSSLWRALLVGWISGMVSFSLASYWLVDFAVNLHEFSRPLSMLMAMLFWAYAGLALALACMLSRLLWWHMPNSALLVFPITVTLSLSYFPLLFHMHFAETQAWYPLALQGVELVGAKGLDALMVMTGVLLWRQWRRALGERLPWWPDMLAALLLLAWFVGGWWRLQYWDAQTAQWEPRRIGLVQPNDRVSIAVPEPREGYSREFPPELAATLRLADAGAEWVVWPEARYKGYFELNSVRMSYMQHIGEAGINLLFHDVEYSWEEGEQSSFNSMAWVNERGELMDIYRKVKLMPFGEYLPEFWSLPVVLPITEKFFGDFLRPLGAGERRAVFDIDGMRVVPGICFETAFPEFMAEGIGEDAAGKLMLFVSQDGWFGQTTQPLQHAAMSVVRGVESRVPMVHLINNGPSVVTLPSGRQVFRAPAFEAGEFLVDLPFSAESGGSFYSRYPWLVPQVMNALLLLMIFLALVRARRR